MEMLGSGQIMTYANALMASVALYLSIRNQGTQTAMYRLTRSTHWSSTTDLHVISAEQLEGYVLVKLVFFNPGSVAALIQSLAIYEVPHPVWWLPRRFDWLRWQPLEYAKWWPTQDENEKTPRLFADKYPDLMVKDSRVILARFPGSINRRTHAFVLRTNHGVITTWYPLDFFDRGFAYHSHRNFT